MFGHPALRELVWLRFKGSLRSQARRLRRPSSWIFLLLGLVMVSGWILSIAMGRSHALPPSTHAALMTATKLGVFSLTVLTLVGSMNHRGLYLPKEEIELCFSAPITRSQLIRYRLSSNLLRSVVAGILFGLAASRRMENGLFAFVGALLTMLTVPILGQASAIVLGDAENRLGKLAKRLPLRLTGVIFVLAIVFFGIWLLTGNVKLFEKLFELDANWSIDRLEDYAFVRVLLVPFTPWASLIAATSWGVFLPWLLFCGAFWLLAYEVTARINVDFRELSLETSADLARRLNRMRRGGVSGGQQDAMKSTIGWKVPWFFGRGPTGAVAWLKCVAMARKARGTVLLTLLVVALLAVMSYGIASGGETVSTLAAYGLLCGLGTLYLCMGLRFDFRTDLDLMQQIKAWPIAPARIFLATLLPEVAFVSILLSVACIGLSIAVGEFHPAILLFLAFEPLFALTWTALDNIVFLFAPVRYSPGRDGALQHMGRSLVLMLLRFVLLILVSAVAVGPGWLLGWWLQADGGMTLYAAVACGSTLAFGMVLLVDSGLVWLGGKMLQRFDVARDRAA